MERGGGGRREEHGEGWREEEDSVQVKRWVNGGAGERERDEGGERYVDWRDEWICRETERDGKRKNMNVRMCACVSRNE